MTSRLQQRRDTAANWTANNPTLAPGEIGLETDTKYFKIGDGATSWTSLVYANGITATSTNTLSNKTLTSPIINQVPSTPTFTTNAYTVLSTDAGQFLLASNAGTAGTIYIPTDATYAFSTGTQIHIQQIGSGQITIQATTPGTTTITSNGSTSAAPKIRAQYSVATLFKTASNTWTIYGDIA
jgi:hypothetical protein